jgi:hypothetical protein
MVITNLCVQNQNQNKIKVADLIFFIARWSAVACR